MRNCKVQIGEVMKVNLVAKVLRVMIDRGRGTRGNSY